MSKTITITTVIPIPNQKDKKDTFTVVVANENITQDVVLEYVSASDGGPLMRPKTVPT